MQWKEHKDIVWNTIALKNRVYPYWFFFLHDFYLELKASLLKTEGEGPTEGILKSSKGSTLSTISTSSLSMSPFGNSAWDNLGETSKLEGSIWISEG